MLSLQLRPEFQSSRLQDTAIELVSSSEKKGAIDRPAKEFFEITYPSTDLVRMLKALEPGVGDTIVLLGDRGIGKSHLMAVAYHALKSPLEAMEWLGEWGDRLERPELKTYTFRNGQAVIAESLHQHRFSSLWDLLFDRHPHGQLFKGKWQASGTPIPSTPVLKAMFEDSPTALVLDEFQTWFESLEDSKENPVRGRAFNFIQQLSELAKDHPELLTLVVSVRQGTSDAYQQLRRLENRVDIDFSGDPTKRDRKRLLLHRLFSNHRNVAQGSIKTLVTSNAEAYIRLGGIPESKRDETINDFIQCWPYSPRLLALLEDQILMAVEAQGTRDLIKILARLFKAKGENSVILTAADFDLEENPDSDGAVTSLINSVARPEHSNLRRVALLNLEEVREAIPDWPTKLPHLSGALSALWLRSLSADRMAGAETTDLLIDLTKEQDLDENLFAAELHEITENSANIHPAGNKLVFRQQDNPDARVKATARNDKFFEGEKDFAQLRAEIRYLIEGQAGSGETRVIILPPNWETKPWDSLLSEDDKPEAWGDKTPLLVLPESQDPIHGKLGVWLAKFVPEKRNTVRFLVPRSGAKSIYHDSNLIGKVRKVFVAEQWKAEQTYKDLLTKTYRPELTAALKVVWDRFAVLDTWNYQAPEQTKFHLEFHGTQADKILGEITKKIKDNLFDLMVFRDRVTDAAAVHTTVFDFLNHIKNATPPGKPCIPWLGETELKERVQRLCAKGLIALNVRNSDLLQAAPGESEDDAWQRLKNKAIGTGTGLKDVEMRPPVAGPTAGGSGIAPSTPTSVTPVPGGLPFPPVGGGPITPAPVTPTPPAPEPTGDPAPIPNPFTGASPTVQTVSSPKNSALNHMAQLFDSGKVANATPVKTLRLSFENLSGTEVRALLTKLSGVPSFDLELDKES
jgi:hypothetical protein